MRFKTINGKMQGSTLKVHAEIPSSADVMYLLGSIAIKMISRKMAKVRKILIFFKNNLESV